MAEDEKKAIAELPPLRDEDLSDVFTFPTQLEPVTSTIEVTVVGTFRVIATTKTELVVRLNEILAELDRTVLSSSDTLERFDPFSSGKQIFKVAISGEELTRTLDPGEESGSTERISN